MKNKIKRQGLVTSIKELKEIIKELEKEFYDLKKCCEWNNYNYKKVPAYTDKNSGIKKRAKQLKEEIEKGCGKGYKNNGSEIINVCGRLDDLTDKELFCPKCQELINRLNKIIGETNGN